MAASEFVVSHPWRTDRRGPVRWLASHILRHPWIIAMVFLGAFGNAALAAAVPLFTGQVFDTLVRAPSDTRAILVICAWLIVSQLVRGVLQTGRNFGSELLGQRLERDARDELYSALLGKSMRFHDQRPSGEIMARATNDVHELALMLAPGLNLVIGSANFLAMPLLFAPAIHPALALTPGLFILSYIVLLRRFMRELEPITGEARRSFGTMNAALTQAVEGIETVKGGAQEARELGRFERLARSVRDAFVAQGDAEARFLPLLMLGLAQGFALWHALALFRAGSISVGDVAAYIGYISLFGFPVFTSLTAYSQAASGVASAQRILELIEGETELDQNRGGHSAPIRGAIRFENVSFRYRSAAPDGRLPAEETLHDVSFSVEPGQTVALVGQTGAGKSTLAKLLNRTYDVDSGRILIDGVDVREWDMHTLRRQISIIEQDIFLFSRSVGENVGFGRPKAEQPEVEGAARAAQAHEFIGRLPEGYETIIGERGVMLSGGQRQRLAIARAFLTQPAILVLDDSTSAIDSATEERIQRAIETAAQGRTTLLITHRLSQIRRADHIIVLRRGRVAAQGSHEALLERSQAYRNIFARM